jgi:glycerol uptake facilitator-like aquaporin
VTPKQLAAHSALELVLTTALLFGVTSVVRVVIGPSPLSRAIPNIHIELLVVGLAVGLLLAGLILSPLGKISGGHMNPAISLAMWRFGVFPGAGVVPYSIAQLAGSLLGVLAARLAWGPVVALPPVSYAVLRPAAWLTETGLFAGEAASMGVIVLAVGLALAIRRLTTYVPWIVGGLIGAAIAFLGTSTGGSVNPAREFGPAVASGETYFLWVYLCAPLAGAVVAVGVRSRIQKNRLLTHRLCGTGYPNFRGVT